MIIGVGGLSSRDVLSVGTVAAFALYLQNLFDPVQQLSQLYNSATVRRHGCDRKLFELLDEKPSAFESGRVRSTCPRVAGSIDASSVSFAYGEDVACSDVTHAHRAG